MKQTPHTAKKIIAMIARQETRAREYLLQHDTIHELEQVPESKRKPRELGELHDKHADLFDKELVPAFREIVRAVDPDKLLISDSLLDKIAPSAASDFIDRVALEIGHDELGAERPDAPGKHRRNIVKSRGTHSHGRTH